MSSPELHVFTYKDGLLARLAHDLQLTLEGFEVSLEQSVVRGTFRLSTLRVDGAVRDGRVDPRTLSESDKRQILESAQQSVLHADRYPEAIFEGRVSGGPSAPQIEGELSFAGRSHPVAFAVSVGDELRVRTRLLLSDWGIPPFKALAGAIRLKDGIDVDLRLPADVPGLTLPDWASAGCRWVSPRG